MKPAAFAKRWLESRSWPSAPRRSEDTRVVTQNGARRLPAYEERTSNIDRDWGCQ
jgi:hypothetical protein